MSWAEMQKMGYAKIICDTSTMTVGDTIRVKSVYNPTQYMDKQVVTVGTPVIFDLGFIKDYVKICTVQTINDTPTEIGGVYKTVDYGQTLFVDTLNLNSLAGHQSLLNAHQHTNKLAIGDEVTITVGGNDWVMQVSDFDANDSNEIVYVSKEIYTTAQWETTASNYDSYYTTSPIRQILDGFYSNMAEKDRQFIKKLTKACHISAATVYANDSFEDYIWLPNQFEVDGTYPNSGNPVPIISQHQMALFVTQANRIKNYQGSGLGWWLCDGYTYNTTARIAIYVQTTGLSNTLRKDSTLGILPCFRLTADS